MYLVTQLWIKLSLNLIINIFLFINCDGSYTELELVKINLLEHIVYLTKVCTSKIRETHYTTFDKRRHVKPHPATTITLKTTA